MNKSVHINWAIYALNKYKGMNRTIDTNMTIGELIEETCQDALESCIMF